MRYVGQRAWAPILQAWHGVAWVCVGQDDGLHGQSLSTPPSCVAFPWHHLVICNGVALNTNEYGNRDIEDVKRTLKHMRVCLLPPLQSSGWQPHLGIGHTWVWVRWD